MAETTPPGSAVLTPITFEDCCTNPCTPCRTPTTEYVSDEPHATSPDGGTTVHYSRPSPVSVPQMCNDCCAFLRFTFPPRSDGDTGVRLLGRGASWSTPCDSGGAGAPLGWCAWASGGAWADADGTLHAWVAQLQPFNVFTSGQDPAKSYTKAVWLYREWEKTTDPDTGDCGAAVLRRAVFTDATAFDCPPDIVGAWQTWPGFATYDGSAWGYDDGSTPGSTEVPTAVSAENCPTCKKYCVGWYTSLYDTWTGHYVTPVRQAWGCIPGSGVTGPWGTPAYWASARYMVATLLKYFTECTGGDSSDCDVPDTIDAPEDGPLTDLFPCPTTYGDDCCDVFGITYTVAGVTKVARIKLSGTTFTSDDDAIAYECFNGYFRILVDVEAGPPGPDPLPGGTYIFVSDARGSSCPPMQAPGGAGYTPVDGDGIPMDNRVVVDSVECWKCHGDLSCCCDTYRFVVTINGNPVTVDVNIAGGEGQGPCTYGDPDGGAGVSWLQQRGSKWRARIYDPDDPTKWVEISTDVGNEGSDCPTTGNDAPWSLEDASDPGGGNEFTSLFCTTQGQCYSVWATEMHNGLWDDPLLVDSGCKSQADLESEISGTYTQGPDGPPPAPGQWFETSADPKRAILYRLSGTPCGPTQPGCPDPTDVVCADEWNPDDPPGLPPF